MASNLTEGGNHESIRVHRIPSIETLIDQIDKPPFVNLHAGIAFAAGLRCHSLFAVQTFSKNTGDGCFSDAAGAGEQKRMMHLVAVKCIDQRAQHMFLTCHFGKSPGTPFAGEYEVTHKFRYRLRSGYFSTPGSSRTLTIWYVCWHRCRNIGPAPATPRHPMSLLPLLPSGPDGVRS